MAERSSFVLYFDIRQPLSLLTDEDRGKLFMALLDYAENGLEPPFSGALQMAFAFIRNSLDRDAAKWAEKSAKRAEAGRNGGRQTQANRANASFALTAEQTVANRAVPGPFPAPAPGPVPDGVKRGADKPPRSPHFVPPTVEEVSAYCRERKNKVDPERFVDFYGSKGWMVGKSRMKDWRAAVRTWEKREEAINDGKAGAAGKAPHADWGIEPVSLD